MIRYMCQSSADTHVVGCSLGHVQVRFFPVRPLIRVRRTMTWGKTLNYDFTLKRTGNFFFKIVKVGPNPPPPPPPTCEEKYPAPPGYTVEETNFGTNIVLKRF